MSNTTLRYQPLDGEPAFQRRRPLALSLPLALAQLVATGLLALLRLVITSMLALVIAVVLLEVGLSVAAGRAPASATRLPVERPRVSATGPTATLASQGSLAS
jgi:hypothetical protein